MPRENRCPAHCKWRFICDADQSWDSFCVAGAVFGEVGGWLFVAGAAFRAILGDSRSAKCCIFPYKMRLQDGTTKVSEAAGARWRFYRRIIVGMSSNRLSIGGSNSRSFCWILNLQISWQAQYLVRLEADCACSAHCKWRFMCNANHDHFSWQAQYLVRFEVDFACSAHCKWRFICDADQSWDSFCVAGAVFGEVGVRLFVAGAAFRAILGDSRSAKCCIFPYKMRLQAGTMKVSEAAGARWRFHGRIIVGLSSDYRRLSSNRLSIGGSNSGTFRWNLELKDFVAGAVFGEVGGWLFVAGAAFGDILGDSRSAKCCIFQ